MRAFDIAHVLAAALTWGVALLVFVGPKEGPQFLIFVALACLGAALGAAIAGFACRRWPGLAAPAWRLWLGAWLFNPVVILALVYVVSQYDCLFGVVRGWSCLGLALAVAGSPLTLIAPTIAVIVHVIARRSQPVPG